MKYLSGLLLLTSLLCACASTKQSSNEPNAASRSTASGPITELSEDLKHLGFRLQNYGKTWALSLPIVENPVWTASLGANGPHGHFTRLEVQYPSPTDFVVYIDNSVGERAELRINTVTYDGLFSSVGVDGVVKRDHATYVRSVAFVKQIKLEQTNDPLYFNVRRYDPRSRRLELRSNQSANSVSIPFEIPPQIKVRVALGQFVFLESSVGCSVNPETPGRIMGTNGTTMINLQQFLKTPKSPYGDETALLSTENFSGGIPGTLAETVNEIVATHYGCETQGNGGGTIDGFWWYRSTNGRSTLFIRGDDKDMQVIPGLGWNRKVRITVTGPRSLKIVDPELGTMNVTLNHADRTY